MIKFIVVVILLLSGSQPVVSGLYGERWDASQNYLDAVNNMPPTFNYLDGVQGVPQIWPDPILNPGARWQHLMDAEQRLDNSRFPRP